MIKLLAFSPLDGRAIIEREDGLFLVSLPFNERNLQLIERKVLDACILRHDFCAAGECFESWDLLISFLNDKVHEARLRQGQNLSGLDLGREIVDYAPWEILNRYLDKVEQGIIPFEQVEAGIYSILESDNPSKPIRSRAIELLKRITRQGKKCFDKRLELLGGDSSKAAKYRCKNCGYKGDTLIFQFTYRGYCVTSNRVGAAHSIEPSPAMLDVSSISPCIRNILDCIPADVSEIGNPIGCPECRNWGEDGFELIKEQ